MRGALCVPVGRAARGRPGRSERRAAAGGEGRGEAASAMVKKRKGRVLIDSDTEDSGSEENLDQVRGEARPGPSGPRGAGSRHPSLPPPLSPAGMRPPRELRG